MCEALGISRSGFDARLDRPRSLRRLNDEVLGKRVRRSFVASDRVYGARRVWHDLLAFTPLLFTYVIPIGVRDETVGRHPILSIERSLFCGTARTLASFPRKRESSILKAAGFLPSRATTISSAENLEAMN